MIEEGRVQEALTVIDPWPHCPTAQPNPNYHDLLLMQSWKLLFLSINP